MSDPSRTSQLRSTFAEIDKLSYRVRAACDLLSVAATPLRTYVQNAGLNVRRASDITPGAPPARIFSVQNLFDVVGWRRAQGQVKVPATGYPTFISVSVCKGGTGKTTTATELAIHLQFLGLRVLLIDADVQGSATHLFGYEPDLELDEAQTYGLSRDAIVSQTFASAIRPYLARMRNGGRASREDNPLSDIIKKPFGDNGPHLIPSDTFLGEIEQEIAGMRGQRELYIRDFLAHASRGDVPGLPLNNYDVVIFDCPPGTSFTTTATLAAADFVVAPIRLDAFSVKGLTKLMGELDGLAQAYHVSPELVILRTHYADKFARTVRMQNRLSQYSAFVADEVISVSEDFPRCLDNYLPLSLQMPTSASAAQYRSFAESMFKKIIAQRAARQSQKGVV